MLLSLTYWAFKKPVLVFLVVAKATSYCCTLPLKVTEEDEEEEEISKKRSQPCKWRLLQSGHSGIFAWKEEQKTALKAFLPGEK